MKKILILSALSLYIGSIAFSASVLISYAQEVDPIFKDLSAYDEHAPAIAYVKDEGMVNGFPDGTFRSEQTINRNELTKILANAVATEDEKKNFRATSCFPDVLSTNEFAPFVCFAKEKGLIKGYSDGKFKGEKNITFTEASKIVLKAFGKSFDESKSDWYKSYLSEVSNEKDIPATIKNPDDQMDRGDLATMILRVKEPSQDYDSQIYDPINHSFRYELPKIESCDVLNNLKMDYPMIGLFDPSRDSISDLSETTDASPASGASEKNYSETNVQVEGVDEGDVVKNDGEYIYTLGGNKVSIVDAKPANGMKVLSTLDFTKENFSASDMYISDLQLVVVGSSFENTSSQNKMMMPYNPGKSFVEVRVYALKNLGSVTDPRLITNMKFEGGLNTSRLKDGRMYVVSNFSPWYMSERDSYLPTGTITSGGESHSISINCNDIRYVPPMEASSIMTVMSFPLTVANGNDVRHESILGDFGTVYMSDDSLIVASAVYDNWRYEKMDIRQISTGVQTVIHNFALGDDGSITYKNRGKVPGTIVNQFSLDEYQGNFRVATTTDALWGTDEETKNNVFILNSDMEVIGKVKNIAPGERIYSTRFMGDRAYMVTFEQTDPFFVIDTSDATNPYVAGELKLPGFSQYLHPLDENHILGFGKDTTEVSANENPWGDRDIVLATGLKLALFDVTDLSNPKLMESEVIGDRGSDSELLWNHKALYFNPSKNTFAFPVSIHKSKNVEDYGNMVFQGAYVYKYDVDTGFDRIGKVTNFSEPVNLESYYKDSNSTINRVVSIGDTMYSISADTIGSYDMSSWDKLGEVSVPTYWENNGPVMYID